MNTINYGQLRRILALGFECKGVRQPLESFFNGDDVSMDVLALTQLVYESEVDCQMVEILTGKNALEMEAFEALEVIQDFFTYLKANAKKLKAFQKLLGCTGVAATSTPSTA